MPKEKKYIIALVEDDPDQILLYQTRLEIDGFEVYSCKRAADLEEIIKTKKPNLILLDIILGVENGEDILRMLKKKDYIKSIPVIIFSNLKVKGDISKYLKLGASDYWPKTSFMPNQVSKKIHDFLAGKK